MSAAVLGGWQLLVCLAGVCCGALVEMVMGFGCTLVWLAILPFFLPTKVAVAVLHPLSLVENLVLLATCWRAATPADAMPLLFTIPFGLMIGTWAVVHVPMLFVNLILGSMITWYAVSKLKKQQGGVPLNGLLAVDEPVQVSKSLTATIGLATGTLMGAFGLGGPPLLVYANEAGWSLDPKRFKANLQILFGIMNVFTILGYIYNGLITRSTLNVSSALLPALVVGMAMGDVLSRRVDKEFFKRATLIGLVIIGVVDLCKAGVVFASQLWAHEAAYFSTKLERHAG